MRRKIVAGNWKMNLLLPEAIGLIESIRAGWNGRSSCELIVAPPYPYLTAIHERIQPDSKIKLAAQDCSANDAGAFTGEVAARQLKSCGAESVIIGHSERRKYFSESNPTLLKKVNQALNEHLNIIFCIGETLDERKAEMHHEIVRHQIAEVIFALDDRQIESIVLAYEPVWAIGTGVNATPAQAQEMHHFIRNLVAGKYGERTAEKLRILYGGSCNETNAGELFSQPDIDGGLIGGASLKADSFLKIAEAALHASA